jgi:polyisoprenoid-binding protein YceI
MMRSIRSSVFAAVALALAVASATAAPVAYKIDQAHSEVGFKIRHFFAKVPGRFNDFAGTLMLDDKNLAASSVDVTIQTTSIYTNNERRDNHLRSDDFFSAEKFPAITFKSTKVTPGEDKKFKIDGDLTMRGVTKPVTLDAELIGMGAIGMGGNAVGTRAGFEATTTVNRKDWGILWNKTLDNGGTMLDDMVAIDLNIEAVKDEPKKDDTKPAAAAVKGSTKK